MSAPDRFAKSIDPVAVASTYEATPLPDVAEIMRLALALSDAVQFYGYKDWHSTDAKVALEAKVTELAASRDEWKRMARELKAALAEAQAEIMRLKLSPAMELGYAREICKEIADLKAKIKQLESL